MVDMSSEYHYGKIRSFDQYVHVRGNMRDHMRTLVRLVTNKPYDSDLGWGGDRVNWDRFRERRIKDLSWAINVQVGWLMQFASSRDGKFWIRLDDANTIQYIVKRNGKGSYPAHQEYLEKIARKYGFASCADLCEKAEHTVSDGSSNCWEWSYKVVGI